MRARGTYIAVVLMAVFCFAGGEELAVSGAELNLYSPDFTTNWDYGLNRIYRQMELRGEIPLLSPVAPYTVDDILRAVGGTKFEEYAKRASYPLTERENLFVIWTPGVWWRHRSWTDVTDTFGRMKFGLGGTYKNWSLVGIYRLDSGYYSDPDYYGIRWERIAGKADQVYIRWSGSKAYLQIGKDYLRIAEGMALSGEKPYERAQFGLSLGEHFSILWFVSELDEYVQYVDTQKVIYNRYLAGHRGQLKWKNFEVGFTELMLFGGVGRQVEFYYLLPFYAFHGEQLNHRWDDNTLWSLDFKVVVPPVRVAFEGILDDFQIEHECPGDREPPEVGFKLAGDVAMLSEPIYMTGSASYEMVMPYTFNQPNPWNRYLYENKPLGAKYGNDYDRIEVGVSFTGERWWADLGFFRMRRGEGRIDDPWTAPWIDDPNWKVKFPSGVVETTTGFEVEAQGEVFSWRLWKIRGQFICGGSLEYKWIDNFEHREGEKAQRYEAKISVEGKLGYCGF